MVQAYLTPDAPTRLVRRCIIVPDTLIPSVGGALADLVDAWNWESFGNLTVEDVVGLCLDIEDSYKDCVSMLGSVTSFIGTLPDGYLPADGSVYNEVDYPQLYAYLGGAGGTFALPDLRDRFIFGASATSPSGTTFGASQVTLTQAQMPAHSHSTHAHYIVPDLPEGLGLPVPVLPVALSLLGQQSGLVGGSQSHENMPPAYSLVVAIRAID